MKNYMILILLLLVVGGCSGPRLMVQMEKGVSLSGYKVFEVMPVSNETGKTFEFDVVSQKIIEVPPEYEHRVAV